MIAGVHNLLKVVRNQFVPVLLQDKLAGRSRTLQLFKQTGYIPACGGDDGSLRLLYMAVKDRTRLGCLGGKKKTGRFGECRIQIGINDRDYVSNLIPAVQWILVQGIKKLIHIKNSRRFH